MKLVKFIIVKIDIRSSPIVAIGIEISVHKKPYPSRLFKSIAKKALDVHQVKKIESPTVIGISPHSSPILKRILFFTFFFLFNLVLRYTCR